MTYQEFCNIVDEAGLAIMMSGPFKDEIGHESWVACPVSGDHMKANVRILLGVGCKVYAKVSGNNWVHATGANPSGDAELITP